jgi:hypothetical protein
VQKDVHHTPNTISQAASPPSGASLPGALGSEAFSASSFDDVEPFGGLLSYSFDLSTSSTGGLALFAVDSSLGLDIVSAFEDIYDATPTE